MAKIDWYYKATGSGQISDIVAHSHASVNGIRKAANNLGDRAASNLDIRAVNRTGDSHIEVEHRHGSGGSRLDSYVKLVDPDGGAAGIEFGWDRINKEGFEYGADGLGVLRDAMSEAIIKSKVR